MMDNLSHSIVKDLEESMSLYKQKIEVNHRMTKKICSMTGQEKGLDVDYIGNDIVTYSIISDVSVYADVVDYEFKKCISIVDSNITIDLSYLIYKIKKVMNRSDLVPKSTCNVRMFVDDKSLGYSFSLDVFVSYSKNSDEVKCNVESYYKTVSECMKLIDYKSENTSLIYEEGDEKSIIALNKKHPTVYKEK